MHPHVKGSEQRGQLRRMRLILRDEEDTLSGGEVVLSVVHQRGCHGGVAVEEAGFILSGSA